MKKLVANQQEIIGPLPAYFVGPKGKPCCVFHNTTLERNREMPPTPMLNIGFANEKTIRRGVPALHIASFGLQ